MPIMPGGFCFRTVSSPIHPSMWSKDDSQLDCLRKQELRITSESRLYGHSGPLVANTEKTGLGWHSTGHASVSWLTSVCRPCETCLEVPRCLGLRGFVSLRKARLVLDAYCEMSWWCAAAMALVLNYWSDDYTCLQSVLYCFLSRSMGSCSRARRQRTD